MGTEYDKSELDASCENELNFEDDETLQNDPEFQAWLDREEEISRQYVDTEKAPF